jgi:PAS domain S-box-containing protein
MDEEIKLLVVDDEEGMRTTLADIFKKKGYAVEVASNGKGAIKRISEGFFNVVLLDIKLPDMSGVQVLKAIKKGSPDTDVIMITAYASLHTSVEALNAGAYAYIMKPFDADSLANTVAGVVERQRLVVENRRLRSFNENIVQSLNEGVLIEDKNGIITFINPKTERILEYPGDEIIGKPLDAFFAAESLDEIEGTTFNQAPQTENKYEAVLITKKGNNVPVIISTVPLFENGKYAGRLSALTDVSKIKSLEEELQKKVEELEHFNRLMVGRELRMVELKNMIKELEGELELLKGSAL